MQNWDQRIAEIRAVHRKIFLVACAILAAHGVAMLFKYGMGRDIVLGLVPLFDFYEENNIPTYFSSMNLLLTALMLHAIAKRVAGQSRRLAVPWQVLSFGFLFMSIDEICDTRMIISNVAKAAMSSQNVTAIPYFSVAWTIPIAAIVVLLAVYFLPFLLKLRKVYLVNFAVAGMLFVFATLGLETIEGFHTIENGGVRDFTFMLYVTLEEMLEIFSIIYFQYYLIAYAAENFGGQSHAQLKIAA